MKLDAKTSIPHAKTAGRPREYNLDHALDNVIDLLCERGYNATSISALADAMGVVPGSIYKAFKDKEALFSAALKRYIDKNHVMLQQIMDSNRNGFEKLQQLFIVYINISHNIEGLKGCLVVMSTVELTTFNPQVTNLIEDQYRQLHSLITDFIILGQNDGSIITSITPKVASTFVLTYLQGMRIIGKLNPTLEDVTHAAELALSTLRN